MLLYEYKCQKCAYSFKKLFLIVDDAPFVCPKCGDNKAKNLQNHVSFTSDKGIAVCSENGSKRFSWT